MYAQVADFTYCFATHPVVPARGPLRVSSSMLTLYQEPDALMTVTASRMVSWSMAARVALGPVRSFAVVVGQYPQLLGSLVRAVAVMAGQAFAG